MPLPLPPSPPVTPSPLPPLPPSQLLEAGYFHADPHPGNLLATRDGRLVYLDFGMMSEAPERARYALIAHVVHLVNR